MHGESDDVSSTREDDMGEVFNNAPLTQTDIPNVVEAVMNLFPMEGDSSQNESQVNPHLGKYTTAVCMVHAIVKKQKSSRAII